MDRNFFFRLIEELNGETGAGAAKATEHRATKPTDFVKTLKILFMHNQYDERSEERRENVLTCTNRKTPNLWQLAFSLSTETGLLAIFLMNFCGSLSTFL